jgi:predicted DNA-binding transcriptional regulator YafY
MTKMTKRTPKREGPGHWSRVIWLDREIREERYPNVRGMQEEFGISRRAAFDTVSHLRHSLGAPLKHDPDKHGYIYTDPTYILPAVFLQEGEFLTLLLAEQVTRQYLGTPLEAPLRAAVGKISRYLPEDVQIHLGDVADCFYFAGGCSVEVPLPLLADVQRAVREQRVLRMLYYTPRRNETLERDVEPHFFRNVRGDWMVVAWDRLRDETREFMLSRIQQHELLEERFQRRPDLDPRTYARHTFLTDHGAEPYEVALRFDAYQSRWIRERVWHPSQQLEEQPDGTLLMRLTVAGEGDLVRWILGYGHHVEVLAPPHLRERVAAEAGMMVGIYVGDRQPPPSD